MAASSGVINGNSIGLYIGTDKIGHGKSNDLSIDMSTIDITTKDSAGWEEVMPGLKGVTFNGEFLFDNDSTWGFEDAFDAITAGTALTVVDMSDVADDIKYTATCYATNVTKTNPANDVVGFNVAFKATGALAKAIIT